MLIYFCFIKQSFINCRDKRYNYNLVIQFLATNKKKTKNMKPSVDNIVSNLLNQKLIELENHFNADFLVYFGPFEGGENHFLSVVGDLAKDENKKEKLFVILTTGGLVQLL
ncbi:MAG: Uncharacterised protein [Polaribacter sp. SA4-10]|nr:MAG: Uncharacterised protein [Polaribacter sp. SA4-10]